MLADPARDGCPITLASCWSHVRRRFHEIAQDGHALIAAEALRRIAILFGIERPEAAARIDAPRAFLTRL